MSQCAYCNDPDPVELNPCAICHKPHHSQHYCGEGEETSLELGVPEGYYIGSDEELDDLMS